ncbi:MAG: ABC transporter permease [Clostridiales bacterium]|jgi:peptide/nickel transport system permease protein|nr:ABC transporter permease [Clostridiales bacterium]
MNRRYVLKKILSCLVVLFVVITLNFFLPRLVFSDPAAPYYAGVPEDAVLLRQQIREEYGFDRPVLTQYFLYLERIFTLDFGVSHVYKTPVFEVMFSRIPWSAALSLTSMIISAVLGVYFGASASKNRGKKQDKILLRLSSVTTAVPTFWVALISVMLFAFVIPIFPYRGAMTAGYRLEFNPAAFLISAGATVVLTAVLYRIFKKGAVLAAVPLCGLFVSVMIAVPFGDVMDVAYHSILPLTVISSGGVVGYALTVRNGMIATVSEDYILTARAKGLPERKILFGHAFRNALLPLVTSLGMSLAGIFGGSVLIEKIFSWPGMGQLLLEANDTGDFQLAQAIMLFFAILTIASNFITDLIYHKLDPRVSVAGR